MRRSNVGCDRGGIDRRQETRDQLMRELDEEYPEYGFAAHKGYGTRAHAAAIIELGRLSPAHRRSVRCKAYAALDSPAA